MKRNEPQPHTTWMYLTNKMSNERSQITECICYNSIKSLLREPENTYSPWRVLECSPKTFLLMLL